MKVTVIPIVIGALGIVSKGLKNKTGKTGDQKKNRDRPDHNAAEVS